MFTDDDVIPWHSEEGNRFETRQRSLDLITRLFWLSFFSPTKCYTYSVRCCMEECLIISKTKQTKQNYLLVLLIVTGEICHLSSHSIKNAVPGPDFEERKHIPASGQFFEVTYRLLSLVTKIIDSLLFKVGVFSQHLPNWLYFSSTLSYEGNSFTVCVVNHVEKTGHSESRNLPSD